jgi:hypothetical protein
MKIVSYLLMSLSSFFFWASQCVRPKKTKLEAKDIECGSFLKFGILIEKVDFNGSASFLCANSQIGFFYKDHIYQDELIGRVATKEEIDGLFEYLANKIDECEELAGKLNAIQRSIQDKQTL